MRSGHAVAVVAHTCRYRLCRAILASVARRIFQFAAGLVLIVIILTPLMESFDHWDKNVVPANDTELNITASFMAAGLLILLAKLLRFLPAQATLKLQAVRISNFESVLPGANERPASTASPPLAPLRI